MSDQHQIIEGASCDKCGGCLVSLGGRISCSECGAVHGLVTLAANIRAHHEAIAGDIRTNTRRRAATRRPTKAQAALARLNNASLFDPVVIPRSDNRNGLRPSGKPLTTPMAKPLRIRLGRTRCTSCDRLLTVASNKVICRGCGMIVADIGILNYLHDELGARPVDGS